VIPPIAVAATAPFCADVFERLAKVWEVTAVLTRPDAASGRGRRMTAPPAKAAAARLRIPVLQPERLEPGLDLRAPTVVVVAYGRLVPDELLVERRWLNVHPSLLPRWRGAAPVERALMAGDVETGVTIHQTVHELDAGPIAAQQSFLIEPDDDASAVYAKAAVSAVELLEGVLSDPNPPLRPQPEAGVTYADKIGPDDRLLDLSRPARELVDTVRALSPHIGARTEIEGRPLTIWRAAVSEDGSFQPLEVQPDGGRRMDYEAWRRGLR
jgi:methionyl-tRNA formyltransferase